MKKTLFVVMLNLIVISGLIISPLPLVSDVSPSNQLLTLADRAGGVSADRVPSHASDSLLPTRSAYRRIKSIRPAAI